MAKKKTSLGCLFWVALVLLIFVIILFNMKRVNNVIKETGFDNFISQFIDKAVEVPEEPQVTITAPGKEPPASSPTDIKTTPQTQKPRQTPIPEPTDKILVEVTTPAPVTTRGKTRKATLYFIKVQKDEQLSLVGVSRAVTFTDAPLTSTLGELLKGPNARELNEGLLNLIPSGSQLRNIYVKNNIAYVDFNENFRFNNMGRIGLVEQLKQVVYTATEFSTVKGVKFLIQGKDLEYLGAEGVYIGKPLGRSSF